ncbi:hypothetical protein mRhiFer1_008000 [Rhinolophus ferrumequinum]|uniref:Secreted protein n=1 Tax=Rhinolophus ferrumequinum TaxID=59479 RepID=A0A7J7WQN4_RHIFE|nr:hypothetical protein mRhiFer1_008000 [Rhinolophus ferrumequinum]
MVPSVVCVAFLWLHGIQCRGCLRDTAFSSGDGLPLLFLFETFQVGNGSQVSSRAVPPTCLVSGDGLGGVRSQASCPLTTVGSRPLWQVQGEAAALLRRVPPRVTPHGLEGLCCPRQPRGNPESSRFPFPLGYAQCCTPARGF